MALNTFSYKERKANVGTLLFKRKESSIKGSGGGGGRHFALKGMLVIPGKLSS